MMNDLCWFRGGFSGFDVSLLLWRHVLMHWVWEVHWVDRQHSWAGICWESRISGIVLSRGEVLVFPTWLKSLWLGIFSYFVLFRVCMHFFFSIEGCVSLVIAWQGPWGSWGIYICSHDCIYCLWNFDCYNVCDIICFLGRSATQLERLQPLLKKFIGILEIEGMPSSSQDPRPRISLDRSSIWLGMTSL